MGGSPSPQTTTTVSQPSPQATQAINMAMPFLQQYAANPPQLPSAPMTAGFTAPQVAGQNMALQAGGPGGPQAGVVGSAAGGENFMTSGQVLSPSSNPALQSWINSAVQPIQQTYAENIMPQISQGAAATGNTGSSEEGIAQGLAARGEQQAIGATTANIANQGYLSGLNAMTQGLALSPAIAGEQTLPATTTSGVGDVQQAQNQAQINEMIQRYMFPQMEPAQMANELLAAGSSIPGGTNTSTASAPQTSLAQMMLGGGALAGGLLGNQGIAGLGSAMGSGISSLGSLLGGAGGAGAGMSALDLLPMAMLA